MPTPSPFLGSQCLQELRERFSGVTVDFPTYVDCMSTLTLKLSPTNNSFEPEKLKNIPEIFLHKSPDYFTHILHSIDPLSWLAQTLSECFAIVVFIVM